MTNQQNQKTNKDWRELDEWLFDYHIRGCEIGNKKANEICDLNKQQLKSFISQLLSQLSSDFEECVGEDKTMKQLNDRLGKGGWKAFSSNGKLNGFSLKSAMSWLKSH